MTSALPAIKGFDRQGEPELRAGDNGGLELVFNFMPPATASGEERAPELFEKFETVLAQVLGVRVLRDDRETFIIAAPKPGTAETLAAYLSNFWKTHAKLLKAALQAAPRLPNAPFATTKAFHAAVVDRLAAPLAKHGFKKAGKSKYRDSHSVYFRRKSLTGMQSIYIHAGHLAPYLHPSAVLQVTHDLVERIYGNVSGMDAAAASERVTISKVLVNDDAGHTVRPYHASQLDAWIARLIPVFEQTGLATLEQMSDPAHIERIFNDMSVDPPAYLKDFSDQEACRGVILAKLLGREDIKTIAAFHHKHLATLEFTTAYAIVESTVLNSTREELIARVAKS